MERLTESSLLQEQKDPNASGWFADNVLHPFMNGTGAAQIYNNFVSDEHKVAQAYVPQAKTLSGEWAIHSLASASGAVLTYAAVGKAAHVGLGAISNAAGLEGTAAKVLTSATTAQIVGAGLFDFAKCPNPGETRLGNMAGSIAAFGVFGAGNEMLGRSKTIANSALLTGLGRVGVGVAGGLTSLETSHLVSKALGAQSEITWDDRIQAMANGGFINVAMPVVQKGIEKTVDGVKTAMNSRPFQLASDEQVAKLPQVEMQKGPLGIANLNLPDDQVSLMESRARSSSGGADRSAELPRLILLKQQFDARARQAQMEYVAGELAGFIGEAKKTVDTSIYHFNLPDAKVENIVVDAYNKAAENGVEVRIAFFKAEEKPNVTGVVGKTPVDIGSPGNESMAHGPSPELLAKLSPKIKVQSVVMPSESIPTSVIPDAYQDAMGAKPTGPILTRLVQLDKGDPGGLSSGVGTGAITGEGHLMHNKYVVRDAATKDAAVWTGSTNFTGDAFGSQDNNIIILKSKTLAAAFTKDFNQMWEKGSLVDTGANLHTSINSGDGKITVAFSPGDGAFIDAEYARRMAAAKESVHVASMVISSPEMLKALCEDIDRGVKVTGIYDGPQMDQVERNWSKGKNSGEKLEMWKQVKEHLVRKNSHPWTPDGIHDFLHDKMFVVDGKDSGTGSFNLSKNATMNAENVVLMDNMPEVASQYTKYIDDLIKTYDGKPMGPGGRPGDSNSRPGDSGDRITPPSMTPEQAQSTFKSMVEDGRIPVGKAGGFVDSVSKQTRPLSPKQLAVVMDIIAKALAREAQKGK
jgi:hypothetical protein